MLTDQPRIPIRSILLYGFWPGFLKNLLYRLRGYRIGKGVSIGFGSVICGEDVEIGDYVSIGFLTVIRGKQIRLESHIQIGALTFLDTPQIEIGEGTKINEQVYVGGLQFPDSRFVVGRNCLIMQLSFINPARSIVIGDNCGIGGHTLIFGHSNFHNLFEGYPVEFAPIEIGNNVGLSWRTFVLPGTRIGDGVKVAADSLVSGTLPPHSMAAGIPARIVGRPPVFPRQVSDEEKLEMFRSIVQEMIQFLVASGLACERDGDSYDIRQPRGRWRREKHWRLYIADGDVRAALKRLGSASPDVFLSLLEIPSDVRHFLTSRNIVWIDITKKEQPQESNLLGEEVLNFFKRYGVRTLRYPRVARASGAKV
jgi:acetyltransferase-like isoleucine patch superfamily enzyme